MVDRVGMVGRLLPCVCLLLGSVAFASEDAETRVAVKANGLHEACYKLRAREALVYRFESDQLMAFSIHYHVGKKVIYPVPVRPLASRSETRFVPPKAQEYCLMWENSADQPVQLSYHAHVSNK
ncbi:hypothetical protein HNQ59_001773 [Chitinivorax tropicus]|uniref:Uncharacterized protein n=1 Tax=Chitinivorax tropicus TaxID=714531 RepID=A0A840MGX8_9PROT|nr:hypothetical protein [Chitinivorax tropicus]MBB5018484.1 hypothetical protein [Chitinivorax tropicus]